MAESNQDWRRDEDDDGDQELDETVSQLAPRCETNANPVRRATKLRRMLFS